jgi:hypothetical protein
MKHCGYVKTMNCWILDMTKSSQSLGLWDFKDRSKKPDSTKLIASSTPWLPTEWWTFSPYLLSSNHRIKYLVKLMICLIILWMIDGKHPIILFGFQPSFWWKSDFATIHLVCHWFPLIFPPCMAQNSPIYHGNTQIINSLCWLHRTLLQWIS